MSAFHVLDERKSFSGHAGATPDTSRPASGHWAGNERTAVKLMEHIGGTGVLRMVP